ncbi:unnamed protein product, partial [Candidula unifasciata]
YDPDEDATRLYKAMQGTGTDEQSIIDIIPYRSNAQRQEIKKRYQELYKKDLVSDIKSETSGDFRETLVALLMPPVEYDAYSINKALKGFGTDKTTLVGVLCSKNAAEIEDIKKTYKKVSVSLLFLNKEHLKKKNGKYKKDLESALKSETNGDLRDFLVDLVSGKKEKDTKVDQKKAEEDARKLHG